jgi:integrase
MASKNRGLDEVSPGVWRVIVSAGIDPARSAVQGRRVYRQIERRFHGNLRQAREFRAQLIVESKQGRYGGTDATVNDLLDAWLRELARIGRAPKTISSYRSYANSHVRPLFGPIKVRDVSARMLADHLGALSESGLAPNTVRLVHACLSSAFSQAARWEWVDKDPTKLVRAPSLPNKRPTIPSIEEVSKLLTAARASKRPEIAAAIWMSATTGIRRGELCGLRITDIDTERGRMQIERAISDGEVWTTKNRQWREVALDVATLALIEAQILIMQTRAAAVGTELDPAAYLFSDHPRGGQPWNPHLVTDAFRRLTKLCYRDGCDHRDPADCRALTHLTFHTLRKFMESRALDAGFSAAEIAHRAGHDPNVLMRFYAGAVPESEKKLAEAVASLLAPKGQ